MAGFWSAVGLAIKSLFAAQGSKGSSAAVGTPDATAAAPETVHTYAIARFSNADTAAANGADIPAGAPSSDAISDLLVRHLGSVSERKSVQIDHHFVPNPDVADPFVALREAQLGVLNAAHYRNATTAFWGRENGPSGQLEIHLISDELASPLYEVLMPLTHCFTAPDHHDTAEAVRILLCAELVHQSRGSEKRSLQMARLTSHLDDFQERIQNGDTLEKAGTGVASAYAFAAYVLAETGDRSYCASAIRVMEPRVRQILTAAGDAPAAPAPVRAKAPSGLLGEGVAQKETTIKETSTEDLIAAISDFDKVDCPQTAVLALYGGLVNWSLVSNMQKSAGTVAVALWKFLVRRFELSGGSAADCAAALCRLGEALVAYAKEIEKAKLSDMGASQFRRAIGMINSSLHAPLYAVAAYGLGESLVASALINDVHIPDEQVIPVFQASLKVCNRREQPYIWGRTMFALATVQLTNGSNGKDEKLIGHARVSFSHAYHAFMDAGAKGAARAASGGYARSENMLSQISHRKAVISATGGETKQEPAAS
ncbi:hypothetical protein [Thalassospira lucentensis]|uniref:hypothetical protein n=1 Tax=Thalassospira lucentensis TaxID=168935 RepID=UPI00142DF9D3|nr:hypothetical protein [Thalassospira lucentensis]NIZ00533.1 hypothetical protein [Thalassospira lucentensis]